MDEEVTTRDLFNSTDRELHDNNVLDLRKSELTICYQFVSTFDTNG
jgi:hypothetical protein